MQPEQTIDLYIAAVGKRKVVLLDVAKNLEDLHEQIAASFFIDKDVKFRVRKIHPISKTPYTIEDVSFLKSGDELEVDILSTQVEFKFSDEMSSVNPIKTNISFPGLRVQEIESDESIYESQANKSSQEDDELTENLPLKRPEKLSQKDLKDFSSLIDSKKIVDHKEIKYFVVPWCIEHGFRAKQGKRTYKRKRDGAVYIKWKCLSTPCPFEFFFIKFPNAYYSVDLNRCVLIHRHNN
jgi:hypothetical protein